MNNLTSLGQEYLSSLKEYLKDEAFAGSSF